MNTCGGWESVRHAVRQRVGLRAFDTWFSALDGQVEGRTLVVRCPDGFVKSFVEGRYGAVIAEAAGPDRAVEYRLSDEPAARAAVEPASAPSPPPVPAAATVNAPEQVGFASFVAGPANALALEAARALVRGELGRCNPLLISGPPGVGKTHLCQAIRRDVAEGVVYRSSEEFTSEVTQGIRQDRMAAVRQRYRKSANLLILEDLQFLQGKRATQVELFHTLDHLLKRGRPVVVTASRPPGELDGLDAQLTSRLASGLVTYIGPPEAETRREILRSKAASGGVALPDACLDALAERPVESVRDLVAGLNQVVARATLLKRPITPELLREALATVTVPGRRRSMDEIIGLVAQTYAVSVAELHSRSRKRRVTRPRQLAMYLCRRFTDASLKEIGRKLGRDHTSVIYAIDVVERRAAEHPPLRYQLEALAGRLGV